MIVEFGDSASAELGSARDHYDIEREGLGDEFVREIEELVGTIGERPESFPRVARSRFRRGVASPRGRPRRGRRGDRTGPWR